MIRRSSMMIVVFVCVAAFASTAQASPVKPLTEAQAKAKAQYFVNRERQDRYHASDRVGDTFSVSRPYCDEPTVGGYRRICRYEFVAAEPYRTLEDGTRVFKRCNVTVDVRKRASGKHRGRVTGRRDVVSCKDYEQRPRP